MATPFPRRPAGDWPASGNLAPPEPGPFGAPDTGPSDTDAAFRELRESEARYRTLVEQIPVITYTEIPDPSSPTGRRDVFLSPQTTALLGYSPDEFAADPELWLRIMHPDDRDRVKAANLEVGGAGQPFHAEFRIFARDGRLLWLRDEAVLVEDPATGQRFWQGVMLDITEERRAQDQVREAELRYQSLVETLPAVVYIDELDEVASNVYTSPHSEAMLGYTPEEWLNDADIWVKLIHPEDLDRVLAAQGAYVAGGGIFDIEYRMVARDGRTVWVRDIAVTVKGPDGTPLYSQGLFLDITAQKAAEQAYQDTLRRERDAGERLRDLDRLKNTLLHTLSHDLKGPLTAILGASSTLERPDLALAEEDTRHLLKGITARARKIDRLLSDLLDLDRLERGIVEPNRTAVDVSTLVRTLVRECEALEGRSVEVEADPIVAELDATKVERMVENMLVNAARHTPQGTRIWARVGRDHDGILIAVEDEGPGVPDELKRVIFEPFRRGPEAGSRTSGSGIGLSLVSRFAELHGGRAWVEDRPGGGASFRVLLTSG